MKLPGFLGKGLFGKKPAGAAAAPAPVAAPEAAAPSAPVPGATGARTGALPRSPRLRVVAAPPPPPPKESLFSRRRIFLTLEILSLMASCWVGLATWYNLMGEWPTFGNFAPPRPKTFESVAAFEFGPKELVWVAGSQELVMVRPDRRFFPFKDVTGQLPSPTVTAICSVSGITWIATSRGLVWHDGKRIRAMKRREPLRSAHVTSLAIDRSGRLWAGTAKDGLFLLEGKTWRQFKDELPSPYVTALAPAGRGKMWVSSFSGEIIRTDGGSWERVRTPERLKGKAVRGLAPLSSDAVLALTDSGLFMVTMAGWEQARVSGLPAKDSPVAVASSPAGAPFVITRKGRLLRISGLPDGTGSAVFPGHEVTAVKWQGGDMYAAADGGVFKLGRESVPLTTWGKFVIPEKYEPPVAELPLNWSDPGFGENAAGLALSAFLLAAALLCRSFRWKAMGERHAWRIGPLRTAAAGVLVLGILFGLQSLQKMSTMAWSILWKPSLVLAALWFFIHLVRIGSHEWNLRRDAFWMGTGFALSAASMWLWWGPGLLLPTLLASIAGAMFFGSSLQGLRQGRWHGFKLAWGTCLFAFEVCALLPPLAFVALTWGAAGFRMNATTPLARNLTTPPGKFTWSEDGLRAAYVVPGKGDWKVILLDGTSAAWKTREISVPWGEVTPTFPYDSTAVSLCYRRGNDTQVELLSLEGKQKWRSRVPGTPVPGSQPCWGSSGDSLYIVTLSGSSSSVWRLGRSTGDATRVARVERRLSWPSLTRDGKRIYCGASGMKEPGLAEISTDTGDVTWIRPQPYISELPVIFEPSMEGQAVLDFLGRWRDRLHTGLNYLHGGLQRAFRVFGWKAKLPAFWPSEPLIRLPRRGIPVFRWSDYSAVRHVTVSPNGKWLLCTVRLKGGGEELLFMDGNGGEERALYSTSGRLTEMSWSWFKNRILVVEERGSKLAPFPARRLLLVREAPDETSVKPVMPLTRWVSSPAFTPDGRSMVFAASDRFWRFHIWPSERFGVYETDLETQVGVFGPPQETLAARQEGGGGGGGGHGGGHK